MNLEIYIDIIDLVLLYILYAINGTNPYKNIIRHITIFAIVNPISVDDENNAAIENPTIKSP